MLPRHTSAAERAAGYRADTQRSLRSTPAIVGVLACFVAAATPNDAAAGLAGAGIPTPSFIAGVALAVASLLNARNVSRTLARSGVLLLFAFAFAVPILVLLADAATGYAGIGERYNVDKPLKVLIMALLLSAAARDPLWRGRLLPAYMVGWWFFVAMSLAQFATGQHVVSSTHYQVERVSILGMNENAQAVTAASGIVLLAAAALRSGRVRDFALLVTGAAGGGFVFVLANSRTGLVALVAGLCTAVAAEWRCRRATRGSVAGVAVSLVAVLVLTGGVGVWSSLHFDVVGNATAAVRLRVEAALDGTDLGNRDRLANRTIEIIEDYPMGVGYGRTLDEIGESPHNDFLKLTAEGGWITAAFLAAAVLSLVVVGINASRIPGEAGALGALVLSTMTALAGQGLVRTTFWFFFSVVVSLNLPPRRTARTNVARAAPRHAA